MLLLITRHEKLFKLLNKFVEKIGIKNVVQVAMDNVAIYVMAGKVFRN